MNSPSIVAMPSSLRFSPTESQYVIVMGSVVIPGQSGPAWAGDPAGEGSAWACATEAAFIAMSAAANATAATGRTMRRSRLLIPSSPCYPESGLGPYLLDAAPAVIGKLISSSGCVDLVKSHGPAEL